MERTTVHKRNRQKAPWLCTQEVTVRAVYLDQCERLKEARQRKTLERAQAPVARRAGKPDRSRSQPAARKPRAARPSNCKA
jgi:hypothetical protein